jgi:hypothetical protein
MQAPIHALVVGAGKSAEFLSLAAFMLLSFPYFNRGSIWYA